MKYREVEKGDSSAGYGFTHVGASSRRKCKGAGELSIAILGLIVFLIGRFVYYKYLGGEEARREDVKIEFEKHKAQYAACASNSKCWAEKHMIDAIQLCLEPIENLSKYSFEWTDEFLERKFDQYVWRDQSKGLITYKGDKIRFQNMYGAMENHVYECDLFLNANNHLAFFQQVRARPGRL